MAALTAGPADATSVSIRVPVAGGVVASGWLAEVRWQGLAHDIDELVLDDDDRVVEDAAGRELSAVLEWSPEIDHDLTRNRCHDSKTIGRRPVVAVVSDPETAAHLPLTIPLRP